MQGTKKINIEGSLESGGEVSGLELFEKDVRGDVPGKQQLVSCHWPNAENKTPLIQLEKCVRGHAVFLNE